MASTHINISILVIAKYSVLLLAGTFYITKIVKTKGEKFQIFGLKNHSEEWSCFYLLSRLAAA